MCKKKIKRNDNTVIQKSINNYNDSYIDFIYLLLNIIYKH